MARGGRSSAYLKNGIEAFPFVIPANAEIQRLEILGKNGYPAFGFRTAIPAFAGMTKPLSGPAVSILRWVECPVPQTHDVLASLPVIARCCLLPP
jgi:hypothetical protein